MLIDAFAPEGITQLAVDSIFMMPQLGVLANIDHEELAGDARKAALEVFHKDCLIRLGTCLAPVGKFKPDQVMLTADLTMPGGEKKTVEVKAGEMVVIPAPYEKITALLTPGKNQDIGGGKGEVVETVIYGGVSGIILDGRGRPFVLAEEPGERIRNLKKWSQATGEYPDSAWGGA